MLPVIYAARLKMIVAYHKLFTLKIMVRDKNITMHVWTESSTMDCVLWNNNFYAYNCQYAVDFTTFHGYERRI